MADYSIEFKIRKGYYFGTFNSLFIQFGDETTQHQLTTDVDSGHIYNRIVTAKFIDRLSSIYISKPGSNKYRMEYITIRHNGILYYYELPNSWMYRHEYHMALNALEGLI